MLLGKTTKAKKMEKTKNKLAKSKKNTKIK